MSRTDLFEAIRPFAPARSFTNGQVQTIDALADSFGLSRVAEPPPPPPPASARKIGVLAGVIGVGAAAILTPFVSGWENGPKGPALVPYRDLVGIWTQCSGETLKVTAASATETPEGCAIKLDKRLAGFAQGVVNCTPLLRGHDNQWAAATSLAYNIGTAAYCRSSADRAFDAGRWRAACDAFLLWDKAGGKQVPGLANRRRAERDLCLKGLPA